ncbi:MAG: response regulator [Clostridia bacterium]|nr:response regulator [Clostridia bacterium]
MLIDRPEPMDVLIVDDEARLCQLLEQYLATKGIKAISTTKGSQVAELMQNHQPKVVLVDLRLSDMSGLEVAEGIRKGGAKSAIIMVSAFLSPADSQKAKSLGIDGLLEKPFDLEKAWEHVQQGMEIYRRRQQQE